MFRSFALFLAAVGLLSPPHAVAAETSPTPLRHVEIVMHFSAALRRVTEAFGPLAEATWDPTFKPTFAYPVPARQIAGAVFHTANSKVWLLHDFDIAAGRVQYVIANSSGIVTLTISITPEGLGSRAKVRYDMVALDAHGEKHFTSLAEHASQMARELQAAISAYLAGNGAKRVRS